MNSVNKYIMAALIFTSLLFIPVTMAGKKVDETIKSDGVNTVTIENLSGKVIIVGWDKEWVTVKGELDDKAKKTCF